MTARPAQILDACVLINLLASGEIGEILRTASRKSLICSAVERESIYLRTGDPKASVNLINLAPLIESGLITVCTTEGDQEAELYVDYASALDDGEAMTLAIAISRGLTLATDDRKARRLFLEATSDPDRLTSTSELARRWAEETAVLAARLRITLLNIEEHARYQPPTTDPNWQWWGDCCR